MNTKNKNKLSCHLSAFLLTIFAVSSVSSMEKETKTGAFFSTRNPSKEFIENYGSNSHQQFQELSLKAIDKVYIFLAKASKNPNTAKVSDFINFIGNQRAWVAEQTNSENKARFGLSRRMKDGYRGMGDLTPLFPSTYGHWRNQIVSWMKPTLEEMFESNSSTNKKEFKYSKLEVSINSVDNYNLNTFVKRKYENSAKPEEAIKLANHEIVFGSTFLNIDAETIGKEEARARALKMLERFDDICVIKAQFFLKMGNDFVPTSAVFMRYLKDNDSEHPFALSQKIIKELMNNGSMIYQHTLQPYFHDTENALDQYYKYILKWQNNNVKSKDSNEQNLLGLLAFFHQIFDTYMPYARGSGAGAEWATRALARTKGFDLHLKEGNTSIVQEDLSQPDVQKFVVWYKENVSLLPFEKK